MKRRNVVYVRVLLVVLAVVVLLAFIDHTPQKRAPKDTWLPSSFNPVGAGNMALFETLQKLHWPVDRWREPLSRLSGYGTGNTLIITRSREGNPPVLFSAQEIDLIDDWVQQGNTLVLLGAVNEWDDTRTFLAQIGFGITEKNVSVDTFLQSFQRESMQTMEVWSPTGSAQTAALIPRSDPLPSSLPANTRVLWEDAKKAPHLVDVPRAKGHVIVGSSDRLLSNVFLSQGNNLAVMLAVLTPDGKLPHQLFFEETHHGFTAVYALARLLVHPGLRFAGMLALLGAMAFFTTSLVRFGPVIPLRRESGRSTLDFVDSIADLYSRGDQHVETVKYLFVETHQRVLHRLNLPPSAPHDLIASRLAQAHPQLPKWKKLAQRFDSHDYVEGLPPSGWLRVARELIEIKSAMA